MKIEYFLDPTKLIHEDFLDQLTKLSYDIEINGEKYDIYILSKCYHKQGGNGDNNLWCIRQNDKIIPENFTRYNGERCCWSFKIENKLIFKKNEVYNQYIGIINRNNKDFYSFISSDFEFSVDKCKYFLHLIKEHPVNFNNKDWFLDLLKFKIKYREFPAIITNYNLKKSCLTIKVDYKEACKKLDIQGKKIYLNEEKIFFPDLETDVLDLDLFDNDIRWF